MTVKTHGSWLIFVFGLFCKFLFIRENNLLHLLILQRLTDKDCPLEKKHTNLNTVDWEWVTRFPGTFEGTPFYVTLILSCGLVMLFLLWDSLMRSIGHELFSGLAQWLPFP